VPAQPAPAPLPEDRPLRFLSTFAPPESWPAASPTGLRQVVVKAMCVRVPAGVVRSVGRALTDGKGADGSWVVSSREAKLLAALLGSTPEVEIVSRPQLCLTHEQTGTFQVGQQVPVVSALRAESKLGADVYTAQVTTAEVGVTLRATPTFVSDWSLLLRVEAETRETTGPALPVVPVGFVTDKGVAGRPAAPAEMGVGLNFHSVRTTATMTTGETLVLCGTGTGASRVVWLITPHAEPVERFPTPVQVVK
jgi:type II secretory pathway component GspD/PulD (secretin)